MHQLWTTGDVYLAFPYYVLPNLQASLQPLPPEEQNDISAIINVIADLPVVMSILATEEQKAVMHSIEFDHYSFCTS
jgi:hypothetical protein